jgi:TolB-like protein/DNA-binding SARP family transcriptional activator/Tfp pilus assembly protein PilF
LFQLKLFGGITLLGPAGPLSGRAVQRHRLGLLALLGGTPSGALTRDKLIAYLWPDADPNRARPLLSDSVYRVNQAVGGEAIVAVGDVLRLNAERVTCDVAEFRTAVERGEWERAVELHAAPFLDGFYLPDAGEFERWCEIERQQLAQEKVRSLETLAATAADPLTSVRWWRRLAAESPYSSRVTIELMRALDGAGERAAAIQQAHMHAEAMQSELGLDADPAVREFAEQLRREPTKRSLLPLRREPEVSGEPAVYAPLPAEPAAPPRNRRSFAVASVLFVALVMLALVAIVRRGSNANAGDVGTSIVVLPFADHSPARDQEYFADGVSEELMVRLADMPGLQVVGRTSSFAFKNKPLDTREIADRLKVNAILSGSVRRVNDQLRITAQLVDARTGYELWSESYQRTVADALDIQEDIAGAIATRLRGELADSTAKPRESLPDDPEAYNLYLRGRFEWHKRTEAGMRNAVKFLTQATQRAPNHARAHAGLGDAYAVLGFYDYLPPRVAFPQAKASALRALQLDPGLAEAHNTLGYVALYHEWHWPQAEREFLRSIELNPRYSTAHQWYANFLTAMGRFDEAVREMRLAQDIDPLSLIANAALGWVLYYAGDYERAVTQLDRTLELNRDFELAHLWRGLALQELKRFPEAQLSLERAVELSRGSAISTALLAQLHARAGNAPHARVMLAALEKGQNDRYTPSFEMAKLHLALGDRAAAVGWLRRAREERSHSIAFLRVDPQLKELRGDPVFERLWP